MAEKPEDAAKDEPKDKNATTESKTDQEDAKVDVLERYLRERLNVLGQDDEKGQRRPPLLEPFSIEGVANFIKALLEKPEACRKILVMTGAGISTAAGIPDFRTPGTGLYDNLQKYNLPHPTAVFEIGYFKENPKPFCMLAKELYPGNFKPTMSHYFIRLLAEKGLLLRNYTQNIDTLERCAGVKQEFLVEAHGNFHDAHCIKCDKEHSHEFVRDAVFKDEIPYCKCGGVVKPDIVFFGESLPERFVKLAGKDCAECELLIVMGTSLAVQPFAGLASRVSDDCRRLLINREKVGETNPLMAMLGFGAGFDFSEETGYRDVFLKSDCDHGCLELAKLLGWDDELKKLYEEEHKKLDEQKVTKQQDTSKPDDKTKQQDISKPDDRTKQQDTSKPDDKTKQQDISKPDDKTKQQDTSKPDDKTKQQDISKPDDKTKQQDISKPDDKKAADDSTSKKDETD